MPEPPPVVSPTMRTLGRLRMMATKLLAALKVERLVSITTGRSQRTWPVAGS